jgi:TetR/AcrR family transcriptional repressor of nem operon
MAENRLRILDCASRLFREKGFDAVTVMEVMKAAGLTHGGFYGHFESKDDLVAHALTHSLKEDAESKMGFNAFIASYLSRDHRDNPGGGCPTAGLVADARHQGASARAAMTQGLQSQIERISTVSVGESEADKRRAAIGTWAAMVGAVIISRSIDDPELADEVLDSTRSWLEAAPALRS